MKTLVFLLALTLPGAAFAQQGRRAEVKQPQMRHEDRQRMREDMNQVYRDRNRDAGGRPDRQGQARPMSPEERQKLRQDVQDANRQLRR